MADWGDYFSNAFTQHNELAQKMAFEKWKADQDQSSNNLQTFATMLGIREKLAEMGVLDGGMNLPSGISGQAPMSPGSAQPPIPTNLPSVSMGGGMPGQSVGAGGLPLVPTGSTKNIYGVTTKTDYGVDPIKLDAEKKAAELRSKAEESKMSSMYNFGLTTQTLRDYGQLLKDSWKEGGAGGLLQKKGTELAMKGVVIGDASKYQSSSALLGKRVEIVSKMMPQLTQQIGKEGSVRLVESIFRKLGQTIPDEATPPELASRQISESILSMYRISRALEKMDLSQYNPNDKAAAKTFAENIGEATKNIVLSEEEETSLRGILAESLKPINEFMIEKYGKDKLQVNPKTGVIRLKPNRGQ